MFRRREIIWALVLGVGTIVISLLRLRRAFDSVWAEDGRQFLPAALDHQTSWRLLEPYAGYLHVVPRLVANIAVAAVPLDDYAMAVRLASIVITAGVVVGVFVLSAAVLDWLPARVAVAAAISVLPFAGTEVLGNLANLHTYLFVLVLWLLLATPATRLTSVVWGVVALACALTEVQCAVLLPLLVWRFRDRRRWPVYAGVLIGTLAQVATFLRVGRDATPGAVPGIRDQVVGFLVNCVMTIVVPGSRLIGAVIVRTGFAVPVVILSLVLASFVVALIRGTPRVRVASITFFAVGILLWGAGFQGNARGPTTAYGSFTASDWQSGVPLLRYGVVPSLMFVSLVILAVGTFADRRSTPADIEAPSRRGPRVAAAPAAVPAAAPAALVLLLVLLTGVSLLPRSGAVPSVPWGDQVATAERACARTPTGDASFQVGPDWTVPLACREVLQHVR